MTEQEICRQALQILLLSNREWVNSRQEGDKMLHIFSNKKGDLDACYIDGNRIIWRVEKADFIDKPGRWRDHVLDEVITFETEPFKINIKMI